VLREKYDGMTGTAYPKERAYNECLDDVKSVLDEHLGELLAEEEIGPGDRQLVQRFKDKIWTEYDWAKEKPDRTVRISVYAKRKENADRN